MAEANPSAAPVYDPLATEVDLRAGILILAAWWREILCLTLLGMVLGTVAYVATLEYEAAADVVVLRARTGVVFDDDRFTTLREQGRQPAAELLAGRDTLFGLATSGGVALAVSERLNDGAYDVQWQPAALLASVDAELVGARGARNTRGQASAMVRITARADSPADAARIANAWAEAYVHLVNTLYAPNSARQLAAINDELEQAQQAYGAAQDELEAFVAANEARSLEQEIETRAAVLEGHFDSEIQNINENRATRRRLHRLLAAVHSLQTQVDAGRAAGLASNTLAIQLLKVEAYVRAAKIAPRQDMPGGLPSLILDADNTSELTWSVNNLEGTYTDAASQRTDLEALDQALRSWLSGLEQAIAAQSASLSSSGFYGTFPAEVRERPGPPVADDAAGASPAIQGHYEVIRTLEARLEALGKREEQLTSQRDRLFTSLDVLRNKEAEFRLAAAVSQPELRLASPAVPPLPLPYFGHHLLPAALVSGGVGLVLGVAVAFTCNILDKGPFLARDGGLVEKGPSVA